MTSKLIVNSIRHTGASADAITMDASGNVTFPANATCSGTATGFGVGIGATETQGYQNLKINTTANNSTSVSCDSVILENSSGTLIRVNNVSVTLDATTTGANGLDTGSLATQKAYHVYIISNGSTTASLASLSSTSPTLPSGYTYKARVGSIGTTMIDSNLLKLIQINDNSFLQDQNNDQTTTRVKIGSGQVGDEAFDLHYVPSTAASWHLCVQTYGATTAGTTHTWKIGGKSGGNNYTTHFQIYHVTANGVGDLKYRYMDIPILEYTSGTPKAYVTTNTNTGPNWRINCIGWRF